MSALTPPPARRCSCGAAAPCRFIEQERVKFVPAGKRYDHTCPSCQRAFSVHSWGAVGAACLAASVVTAGGALVTLHPPGSAVGAASSNRWFGVGMLVVGGLGWLMALVRLVGRFKHPAVQ